MKPSTPFHGRSAAAIAISAALHAVAFIGTVWLAVYAPESGRRAAPPAVHPYVLTFLRAPEIPLALRMPARKQADAPRVDAVRVPERPPVAHVEPEPLPVVTPVPPPPVRAPDPDLAKPVKPVIAKALEVGVFDKAANIAQNPTPGRQVVETAGFDTTPAQAPEMKLGASTSLGGFDRAANPTPRPGTDKPVGSVADAGFGGAAPGAPARPPAAQARVEIRAGTFDIQPAQAPVSPPGRGADRASRPGGIDVPVEILFKPTPSYTDEARALGLEGEVVLEVEFCSSRQVRVLRVISGIGHGLDESATRAAAQIRFKPAQAGGKAVDFRATLRIMFRLT
jgi:TonB family protein